MRKTAIYSSPQFLDHQPGFGHVESPDRLRGIYQDLAQPEQQSTLFFPEFSPASFQTLALNHEPDLVARIAETAGKSYDALDADTQTSAGSFAAACLAAGSLIDGIKRLATGEIDNGFCLVRPPGHHAESDRAMGFCLFNNVAVAAHWALSAGKQRIMIIDWDLHHGNGTQRSFYQTDQVLYFSTHQYPYYPGSGALLETGQGRGEGYTINVPLPAGQGDEEYAAIWNQLLTPLVRAYQPELILLSCGFDICAGDPLGGMQVTPKGFAYLTRCLVQVAEEVCGGQLLVTLEGGYDLTGMRQGAGAVINELYGTPLPGWPALSDEEAAYLAGVVLDPIGNQALKVAKSYWSL